jgi:hypothetical protein
LTLLRCAVNSRAIQKGVRVANASMMNELQRRLDAKDTEIRAKVAKIDELNQVLHTNALRPLYVHLSV